MNQERPSDVPYSVSDAGCLVFRNGRGVVNFDSRRDAINAASLANRSHAEGRKAAEKDFQELLDMANELNECYKSEYEGSKDMPVMSHDFEDWKKARGIE